MEIWSCGSSPRIGSRNAWTRIKNFNGASRLNNVQNFFGAIQMISCRVRLVTMDEKWLHHYDPETKQQLMGWRHSGSLSPKIFQVRKSAEKFLASIFLGSRRHPPHWLSSKGPNYQRQVLLISACAIEGRFERKTPRERHQVGLVLARQCPVLPGNWNPEVTGIPGIPLSRSPTLFSGSGPVRLPPVPWTEKQLKYLNFSSDAEAIAAAETWLDGQRPNLFMSGLQKLKQRAKKCIEIRGDYVE